MAQGNWMRISIALSQKVTISVRLSGWLVNFWDCLSLSPNAGDRHICKQSH